MTTTKTKTCNKNMQSGWHIAVVVLPAVIGFILLRNTSNANDPLSFMIPNFLLFTPFREATLAAWEMALPYNTSIEREPVPIPELTAQEFSFESLRLATDGFRVPVVVRGLFSDTTAVQRWAVPGYLSSKLGGHNVTALVNGYADNMADDRVARTDLFSDVFEELLSNQDSPKFLFFPLLSRVKKGETSSLSSNKKQLSLRDDLNRMVREDLDLNRLWPGFGGTERHRTYIQFIAVRGFENRTTGSNWHSEPGNNWFVQVAGVKRWFFMEKKYSAYMLPMRDGINSIGTGSKDMAEKQKFLPITYVDLGPGDMLYNPDFVWHAIRNNPGLSIGVPIRELNLTLSIRNNMHYLSIIAINNAFAYFGLTYGQPDQKDA